MNKASSKNNKALMIVVCAILAVGVALENAYISHIWADWVSIAVYVATSVVFLCTLIFCITEKEALFKLAFIVIAVGLIIFSVCAGNPRNKILSVKSRL